MTKQEVDIYRDTWVRYCGYANEVGESFRYVLPRMVVPSYGVSFGYVFADARDKYLKTYKKFFTETQKGMSI